MRQNFEQIICLSSRKQLPLVSDQRGRHFGWLLSGGWTVHVHTVQCILVNLMVRLVCTNVSAVIQLHVTNTEKQAKLNHFC